MQEIIRNRTIRPSTRLDTSVSYKIDTSKVTANDLLIVNIKHESKPFKRTYKFNGIEVAQKNSIHLIVNETAHEINIKWSGAQPK